jgi:lipoprotein-releasing system ATP-binding protein
MSNALLAVKDLCKVYRYGAKDIRAVDGVSLEIGKGSSVAIVGPSGAGKSTLMHVLGGLDRPTSGKVFLDGIDVYKTGDRERAALRNKRIGFVFQFYHLLPEFTALENVMLPMLINSSAVRSTQDAVRKSAVNALKSVGLDHRMDHQPSRLSGGESQRVAIARALVNDPDILLCDEPTGNLDSRTSEAIYELLFDIHPRSGTTLVIVTHDEKLTPRVGTVIRLKDGKTA